MKKIIAVVLLAILTLVLLAGCNSDVAVEKVTINETEVTLELGASKTLSAYVSPEDATSKVVTWSTSDASTVSVSESGVITGVKTGSATITATAGEASATCTVTVVKSAQSVTLNKEAVTVEVNGEFNLVAIVDPADATETVVWSTSDASKVTVENGKIKGVAAGSATVTATVGSKSAQCVVTVVKNPESVSLNKTELTLEVGAYEQLTYTAAPSDASGFSVTWETSDATKVLVSNDGKVTAVAQGTATVKVTTENGKSATCTVTVVRSVSSVTLSKSEDFSMNIGSTETLVANVYPIDATDKTVSWSSDNTDVAEVVGGVITAKAIGVANITATSVNGKSVTVKVTVVKGVESITIYDGQQAVQSVSVEKGNSVTLTATIAPADATDTTLVWESSNPAVVTVEGGVVTAVEQGNATITVKCGGASATCVVTVTVNGTAVRISQDTAEIELGSSFTLGAEVLPEDATDKTIVWSTSAPTVATVEGGVVTAVGVGTAYITASSNGFSATCVVTVIKSPESISLDKTELTLEIGANATLEYTINPSDATNKAVTWSTDNAGVCRVEGGKITAVAQGTAKITVTTANGKSATCTVTVIKKVVSATLSKDNIFLYVGGKTKLNVTLDPSDASEDVSIVFISSDDSVVDVDNNGNLVALKEGTAKITVYIVAGGSTIKADSCNVTVKASSGTELPGVDL